MNKKLKVALWIGGSLAAFTVTVSAVFFYWLSQNKAALKQSRSAGLAFGKQLDDYGCWQEALKRQQRIKDYKDSLQNDSFLLACLAAAANPPGFCDSVPLPGELLASARWTLERCVRPEMQQLGKRDCQGLLRTLQTYCSEYYRR